MTTNIYTARTGRFASQMLSAFGVQRTARTVQGTIANTFKYATGHNVYTDPTLLANVILADGKVSGYCSPDEYDQIRCFFLSRGAGPVYADTMAFLTVDMARMLAVTTTSLLEQSEVAGKLDFSDEAYYEFNKLRDPGNQVTISNTVSNQRSMQARQIRA